MSLLEYIDYHFCNISDTNQPPPKRFLDDDYWYDDDNYNTYVVDNGLFDCSPNNTGLENFGLIAPLIVVVPCLFYLFVGIIMFGFPSCFPEYEGSDMSKCCSIDTNRRTKAFIFFILFCGLAISTLLWLYLISGIRGPLILAVVMGALILLTIGGVIWESILTCIERNRENRYESERYAQRQAYIESRLIYNTVKEETSYEVSTESDTDGDTDESDNDDPEDGYNVSEVVVAYYSEHPNASAEKDSSKALNRWNYECGICNQRYQKDDVVCFSTFHEHTDGDCCKDGHSFHKDCALQYLQSNSACAVCKIQYIGSNYVYKTQEEINEEIDQALGRYYTAMVQATRELANVYKQ